MAMVETHKRIHKLLEVECLTFAEIGRRVGLSRERVRQIATTVLPVNGRERQEVCANTKALINLMRRPSRMQLFIRTIEAVGLRWEPIWARQGVQNRYSTTQLLVEGSLVRVQSGKARGGRAGAVICPARTASDFTAWQIDNDRWLILPAAKVPPKQTSFVLEEPKTVRKGADSYRHDYRDYINRWDLFKSGACDTRESSTDSSEGSVQH